MSSFISGLEIGGWPLGAAHSPSASGSARGPKQSAPKHWPISLAAFGADAERRIAGCRPRTVPPKCGNKAGGLHRLQNDAPAHASALECRGGLQPLDWPRQGLRDNGRICAQRNGAHAKFSEGQAGWRPKKRTVAIRFGCRPTPREPISRRRTAGQGLAKANCVRSLRSSLTMQKFHQAQQPHWIGTKCGDRSSSVRGKRWRTWEFRRRSHR